jgi:hypothetical protein
MKFATPDKSALPVDHETVMVPFQPVCKAIIVYGPLGAVALSEAQAEEATEPWQDGN